MGVITSLVVSKRVLTFECNWDVIKFLWNQEIKERLLMKSLKSNSIKASSIKHQLKKKNHSKWKLPSKFFLTANTLLLAEKIFVMVSPVLYLCTSPSGEIRLQLGHHSHVVKNLFYLRVIQVKTFHHKIILLVVF